MQGKILRFGKWGVYFTIPGVILAWFIGVLFMPKTTEDKVSSKMEGTWFSTTDSGFKKLEIKNSGYFYFNDVSNNSISFFYKGVITETIKDTLALIAFNNDTLLYHKIIELDKKGVQLKSIKDSAIINFKKEK